MNTACPCPRVVSAGMIMEKGLHRVILRARSKPKT